MKFVALSQAKTVLAIALSRSKLQSREMCAHLSSGRRGSWPLIVELRDKQFLLLSWNTLIFDVHPPPIQTAVFEVWFQIVETYGTVPRRFALRQGLVSCFWRRL